MCERCTLRLIRRHFSTAISSDKSFRFLGQSLWPTDTRFDPHTRGWLLAPSRVSGMGCVHCLGRFLVPHCLLLNEAIFYGQFPKRVHLTAPLGVRGDSHSLRDGLGLGPTCQRISRLISLFCPWPWAQLNRKKRQADRSAAGEPKLGPGRG